MIDLSDCVKMSLTDDERETEKEKREEKKIKTKLQTKKLIFQEIEWR
jgi:hypothetical protein